MGKRGVEDMINEIEIFIDNCKFQPWSSNRIIVQKDELESLLNELKLKMPSEIERSKKIMRNKELILSDARTRSEAMITEASNEARKLVDNSEIVALANIRAEEIMNMVNQEANEIIEAANQEANEIRFGMMEYTTDMLNNIQSYIQNTMEVEKTNYSNLIESLQNNVMVIEANRKEIEEQKETLQGSRNMGQNGDLSGDSVFAAPENTHVQEASIYEEEAAVAMPIKES